MKKFISYFTAVTTIVAMSAVAFTAQAGVTKPKLSFVKTNATIAWSNDVGSSPAGGTFNQNTQALKINATGTTGSSGASAYTYGPDENLVGIRGLTLAQITHLGFDSKGYLGAGAPRISLGTKGTDGLHTYFLVASYCNNDIGNGWRTSDFVHDTTDCTIFRDGVPMTWAAAVTLAAANNEVVDATANDWFLIVDEAPSVTYIDRLSVQNWCWLGNGTNGTVNQNTAACM